MEEETGVRRSGRQKSLTKFFVPHFDESYEKTDIQKQEDETVINAESDDSKPVKQKRGRPKGKTSVNSPEKKPKVEVMGVTDVVKSENVSPANKENIPGSSTDTVNLNNKSVKTKAAPKKRAPANKPKDGPTKPKRRKTKLERIEEKLKALGIESDDENGNCARAAIYRGSIKLTGSQSDLDQVILSGTLECGHSCNATLRDLLKQPDYAGMDYEDGLQEATVVCDEYDENECEDGRTYVTHICSGNPSFDSGKFHNHCTTCKNYGMCIGDYREAHCDRCGRHYFAGSGGQFKCGCRRRGFGGGFGDCSDSSGDDNDDCVLM